MQPPDPRNFARLLDQPQGVARAARFFQQHADVDPLVAHQIRRVAQDAVTQGAFRLQCFQFGFL
jgi:hypothetical protein